VNPVAFYIRNHSSSELFKAELASLPSLSTRPQFAAKDEFAKWCHDASTEHVFYTLAEPEFPAQRSSGQNPIKYMHGLIADYDGMPEAINAELAKLKFSAGRAPTWVTTTFSGKARLIWVFERPVPAFSAEVMGKFKVAMAKELKVKDHLPGLDEVAWNNPHTPYELGTNWRQPWGDARLPANLVMAALCDASEKAKWKVDGPVVPMEAVAAEVDRRWPGRWPGPFLEGAKGVRFWDPKADNPTGCTLRATGVQAWTGEAKFMPWAEVLGAQFVAEYRANKIGGAINAIYYDGQLYWEKDASGIWQAFAGNQMGRRLQTDHGLSNDTRRSATSEVASALSAIENTRRVDGAFPCIFLPEEVVHDNNSKYLNISRVKPHPTTGQVREWGDGFPWLAQYLGGLFDRQQLDVLLSWLGRFYNTARVGKPRKGHALFICGDVSAGKTFLSQHVIGGLMGGHQAATSFILGHSGFNEQLFHAPVWSVDDAAAASERKRHQQYSAAVKKLVANPYQEFHPKFRKAVTHRFNGRLIVTLNSDATSVQMLPSIEGSIRDKLVILLARKTSTDFSGCEETVARERQAFADFMAGWKTPEWLLSKQDEVWRFGHDSWLHPEMMDIASDASPAAALRETLDTWRVQYFRQAKDKEQYWFGTASDLVSEIQANDVVRAQLPRVADIRNHVKQQLNHLCEQQVPWLSLHRNNQKRGFKIMRPEEL